MSDSLKRVVGVGLVVTAALVSFGVLAGPAFAMLFTGVAGSVLTATGAARDGDLVMVRFDDEWHRQWVESLRGHPDLELAYGGTEAKVPNLGVKLLKSDRGEYKLCALDDCGHDWDMPLGKHVVLGVVVHVFKGAELEMLSSGTEMHACRA